MGDILRPSPEENKREHRSYLLIQYRMLEENTAKSLAEKLSGCEYREELSKEDELSAERSNLVVVFGASDDLIELRGAINDEAGLKVHLNKKGILCNRCDEDDCPYFKAEKTSAQEINRGWCEGTWQITTEIPHERFKVMEDGEEFGNGIVFSLDDLRK
jgi:hypothetical protein